MSPNEQSIYLKRIHYLQSLPFLNIQTFIHCQVFFGYSVILMLNFAVVINLTSYVNTCGNKKISRISRAGAESHIHGTFCKEI
jgi:hypothetical protein